VFAALLAAAVTTVPAVAQPSGNAPTPGEQPPPASAPTEPPAKKTPANEKLEQDPVKAQAVTKTAELTPIVPSPNDPFKPAFQLYSEIDIPILAVGVVFSAARLFRTQQAYCAPLCDKSELNAVDRVSAGRYDKNWALASDFGLYGLAGGAAVLLSVDEGLAPALNDSVVIAQSALLATALASTLTLAAGRPRPYLYGDKAPLAARNSPDAGNSFLSSHTAVSFAIVTSSWMAMRRLEPTGPAATLTLVTGLGISSFVGVARVVAGQHFISDAIGGALVGASTGILVPALHSTPVKIVPQLGAGTKGLAAAGQF
jgi:membrane-associated phospholipid phosphatase